MKKQEIIKSKKIVKLTSKDEVPSNAKFLYAKEEFVRMVGWISNQQPCYQTTFYYEVDSETTSDKKIIPSIRNINFNQSENNLG